MDPEAEYTGSENKYGVTKSETHEEAQPVETETKTESRGLFGFGVSAASCMSTSFITKSPKI